MILAVALSLAAMGLLALSSLAAHAE